MARADAHRHARLGQIQANGALAMPTWLLWAAIIGLALLADAGVALVWMALQWMR
jgi:hypothetical protein